MTPFLLGRICRTCLLESSNMHKLIDPKRKTKQIDEMFNETIKNFDLYLELGQELPLPVEICSDCFEKLIISFDFREMCLISNERLRDFFYSSQTKKTNDVEDHARAPTELEENFTEKKELEYGVNNIEGTGGYHAVENNNTKDNCFKEKHNFDKVRQITHNNNDNYVNESYMDSSDPIEEKRYSNGSDIPQISTNKKRKYTRRKPLKSNNKTCLKCHKVFKKRMYLTRHLPVHSLENEFVCNICEYRYQTAKLLNIHKSRKHGDVVITVEGGPFRCSHCSLTFEQTRALAAHRVMHSQRDFNCEICGVDLKTLGAITRHMNCKHPGELPYRCEMCDKAFPVKTHYQDHLRMHKGYKKYKCALCEKSFPNSTALKDHIRMHTGESPFLCCHCGKTFKTTNILRQHIKRHGEPTFQCPKCPSKFYVTANLRQHMSTHSKEKPHICDVCGSAFTRPDSLKLHKFKHSGQRPFKCDQCNMSFAFKAYLTRHKIRHTGEKPFSCSYCDRSFGASGDLVKHLRTHVGENTYFCDICPQTFRYKHDLRDHKNNHYNEERKANEKEETNVN